MVLLILPAGCPAPATLSEVGSPPPAADVGGSATETRAPLPEVNPNDPRLQLLARAEKIVEAEHPRAVLVEARGTSADGTATTADDILTWRFLFTGDSETPGATTVVLEYAAGEFGEPELLTQRLVGTMHERLPRTMTLTTAIQFLRDAGHDDPFSQVVLRKPLTFPVPDEAFYIFTVGEQAVFVGTETGKVNVE